LFAADSDGVLQQRMDDALDGDYQMYSVLSGDDVRKHWVRGDERLAELMQSLNDEQIRTISRGGHDHHKVFAAYHQALQADGQPTVILAKTIKGFTMGSEGEGRNTVHQKKTMSDEERMACAQRLGIPITNEAACAAEFYLPDDTAPEMEYLRAAREGLGGFQPTRSAVCETLPAPTLEALDPFLQGTPRQMSTTMVMVRLLAKLLRDKEIGKYLVPIVPDEARTFGMDGLFRQVGIYSADGQQYEPVDADTLMPYRESRTGQILQEGICEAGAIASFLAAGTAYSHFGVPTIPFYFFYSMFGFQRVGDFIWAGGDALCRGFLIGGTAGRTTLNGEGVQHQDGHSHVLAGTVPSVVSYDPCFGFELAIIVREGIRRMYENHEAVTYYITVYNENYSMPAMPSAAADGILKGLYRFNTSSIDAPAKKRVQLFGSGAIMQQVLLAQQQLESQGVAADVWSATSYTELYRDAVQAENDGSGTAYLTEVLAGVEGPIIAVSDYMSTLPLAISKWLPGGRLTALGTDGFGLSESRESLRQHFGVDAASICEAAMTALRIGN
jgi:pyruvate dehydrogenase E1 component